MEFNLILILRIVQMVFAIIVLGLTGHAISEIDSLLDYYGGFISYAFAFGPIRFLLFTSVWTFFIVVPYIVLAPLYLPALASNKFGLLGLEGVTTLFWFAGFIAVAAKLPEAEVCSESGGLCQEMQAASAFGAFTFAAFVGSIVLTVLQFRNPKPSASAEPAAGV